MIESLPKIDRDELRRATEALQRAQAPKIQRAVEDATRALPRQDLQRLSEIAAQSFSRPLLLEQLDQVARANLVLGTYDSSAVLASAGELLEQEVEVAGDLPESDSGKSLAWWLATRPFLVQIQLLNRGLVVLTAFTALAEEATGDVIPDSIQLGTAVCLAIVEFLLLWIAERDKPE